ncbi:hypothetical protein BOX37_07640 [Nocardia mangyaensis]|uniref:DUF4241 domain-containing protein n=1 Tax=Nocardia mangyaensis TaxID=2213200 RepID=A0A1J0VPF8_9NOCA|nr:DUF4241 domain-containing protein [Nocardia mangyaensis]APE33863.1 hypothetical protein BOX37_07640 [Nocardia mangyaensis]
MVYDPDLDILMVDGYRHRWKRSEFVIESCALDPVVLPTGRVVACDPLSTRDDEPFPVTVAPGAYPLFAWVATQFKRGKQVDRRNALLELRISAAPALTWEMAFLADESAADLREEGAYTGHTVDAGCATLADVEALKALWRWDISEVDAVYVPRPLPTEPALGYISAVTDEETGANVSILSSGRGNGVYPTFVLRGEHGEVTGLVTDFMLFPNA